MIYIYICIYRYIWRFPQMGDPQNGWFIMEIHWKWMIPGNLRRNYRRDQGDAWAMGMNCWGSMTNSRRGWHHMNHMTSNVSWGDLWDMFPPTIRFWLVQKCGIPRTIAMLENRFSQPWKTHPEWTTYPCPYKYWLFSIGTIQHASTWHLSLSLCFSIYLDYI